MLWTIAFWQGAGERAIKTFFQVLAALVGADASGIGQSVGLGDIDWQGMLSIAAMAALVSIFTSIANPDFVAGKDALTVAVADAVAKAVADMDEFNEADLPSRAILDEDGTAQRDQAPPPFGFHMP